MLFRSDGELKASPGDPMLRLTKGDVLAQNGDYAAAREIYSRLRDEVPQWDVPRMRLREIDRLQTAAGGK